MKIFDEIVYSLQKLGAEKLRALSNDMLDFDLYDVRCDLSFDTLKMTGEVSCCVFDTEQREEEDLSESDIADVTNVMCTQTPR